MVNDEREGATEMVGYVNVIVSGLVWIAVIVFNEAKQKKKEKEKEKTMHETFTEHV